MKMRFMTHLMLGVGHPLEISSEGGTEPVWRANALLVARGLPFLLRLILGSQVLRFRARAIE